MTTCRHCRMTARPYPESCPASTEDTRFLCDPVEAAPRCSHVFEPTGHGSMTGARFYTCKHCGAHKTQQLKLVQS